MLASLPVGGGLSAAKDKAREALAKGLEKEINERVRGQEDATKSLDRTRNELAAAQRSVTARQSRGTSGYG